MLPHTLAGPICGGTPEPCLAYTGRQSADVICMRLSFSCCLHEPPHDLLVIHGAALSIKKKHPDIVHSLCVVLVGSLHEPLHCKHIVLINATTGLVEQAKFVLGVHSPCEATFEYHSRAFVSPFGISRPCSESLPIMNCDGASPWLVSFMYHSAAFE